MKKLTIALSLLLVVFQGRSQSQNVPSLLEALKKAESDSAAIAAYQHLVESYQFQNADSALYYAREGREFARLRAYRLGEGKMLRSMGQVHERHGLLDLARSEYYEAREIFRAVGFRRGVAATTNGLGVIAGRTGKYDEATRYFLEALKQFEEIKDPFGVLQAYIKLGVVADLLGNLDEALEYYLKAEALNAKIPSSNATLTLLNNIGIVYGRRNDIPTALKYFHRGLRQCNPKESTGIYIALLGSLGTAYEQSGNVDSALFFQEQALAMARTNNLPEEEARALVNMASLFSETDPASSLAFLRDALAITKRIQQLKLMTEVYEAMIALYKNENDFEQALLLTEEKQLLEDSLFSLQKSKEIANLHAHQALAKQENELRNLEILHEKSVIQRNILIVIALVCMALIGIVWFYNSRISNLNRELMRKQTELRNSNSVKDKLFSILGHDLRAPLSRVIGLLNVLSIKEGNSDESVIINKLRQQSANTLDTLDNLLLWGQRQLKGVRLSPQTFQISDQITKSLGLAGDYATQKEVKVVNEIPAGLWVHADPSHFDFIIRNILSNAIKFSHSGGSVVINARTDGENDVVISVRDSGIGIPQELQKEIFTPGNQSIRGTWNEKGTGIGLMLCREYVSDNGGRLWVESEAGKGSTFYFSLPKTKKKPKQEYEPVEAEESES